MLLIRRVRTYPVAGEPEPKSYETGFEPPLEIGSLAELLRNNGALVKQVPEKERWNCYYTQGHSHRLEGNAREWVRQTLLPFDLDGIEVRGSGDFDPAYVETFFKVVTGVDAAKTAVVFSGNGLHFLVDMQRIVSEKAWFEKHRVGYETLVAQLNEAYQARGLRGQFDTAVFAPNRILRLPGTENRKAGREPRTARVVAARLEAQDVTPCSLAGIPEVKPAHALSERQMRSFVIDSPSVEQGCRFLQWAKAEPAALPEPAWYALLSVVGRLEDGEKKAHEYSAGHPTYDATRTARKLRQAVAASGPRTCENIAGLWEGCNACPHYKRIASPVCIKSDEFIATEESGFHTIDMKGKLVPQFEDLASFLDREQGYVTHAASGNVYIFSGSHYERQTEVQSLAYAQSHFRPRPRTATCTEFAALLTRTKHVGNDFFSTNIDGKVNLANGVFDIEAKTLEEPSRKFGFKNTLPFPYDPAATAPRFAQFLDEVTCGDAELAELLLEFLGYAVCDRSYPLQRCLVLTGHGSNGKSTMLEVFKALIGEGNYSVMGMGEMQSSADRLPLEKSLANICDEMPPYALKSTELLKKLMGGETQTRALYQNAANTRCMAKFIFSCNELPASLDQSHGFYRRLVIVPFSRRFEFGRAGGAELGLVKRLKGEAAGIFNMALAAYQRLMARGDFHDSIAAAAALAEYRGDNDLIGTWFGDFCIVADKSEHGGATVAQLYTSFSEDMRRGGHKISTRTQFTQGLRRLLPDYADRYKMVRNGKICERVVRGVKLDGPISTREDF